MNDGSEPSKNYVAQEGGHHYQAPYQHWDWVTDLRLPYLTATATKYITRWRKKNGLQDLRKALTYIEKRILVDEQQTNCTDDRVFDLTSKLADSTGMDAFEFQICYFLARGDNACLSMAKEAVIAVIRRYPEETVERAAQAALARAGVMASQGAASPPSARPVAAMGHPAPYGYTPEG